MSTDIYHTISLVSRYQL